MSFERPNGPTFFGDKDTLPTGNGDKIIKGSEVDADFNAISTELNNLRNDFGGAVGEIPDIEGGASDGEVLSWSDAQGMWTRTDTLKVQPTTVNVNGALTCTNSTELGNDNTDQHVFHGDLYVGYADPNNVPDTAKGDTVPGTLFLSRGVKLVRDPADSTAHEPGFNANGFKLVQLGNADSDDQAPNWGQVKSWVRNRTIDSNVSMGGNGIEDVIANWEDDRNAADVEGVLAFGHGFRDSILVAVQTSNDFETLKQRLVDVLTNFDVRAAAKGAR